MQRFFKRWAALQCVALLAGCAAGGGSCRAPCTVAIVRLAPVGGHLAIPMQAGGASVEAVLDTGASTTTVTPAAATALDARPIRDAAMQGEPGAGVVAPTIMSGFGGDTAAEPMQVENLDLAGGHLRDALVVEIPSLRFADKRIGGLVGGDLLASWDLDLDVGRRVLALDLRQSSPVVPPWHDSTTRVPFADDDNHIVIDVLLDGHPLKAIVDTGARTLIDGDTAAGAEVAAGDVAGKSFGIAGVVTPTRRHHFADLSVGGLSFGPLDLNVATRADAVPGADMLLGLDVLRLAHVYVAYGARELLIDEGTP